MLHSQKSQVALSSKEGGRQPSGGVQLSCAAEPHLLVSCTGSPCVQAQLLGWVSRIPWPWLAKTEWPLCSASTTPPAAQHTFSQHSQAASRALQYCHARPNNQRAQRPQEMRPQHMQAHHTAHTSALLFSILEVLPPSPCRWTAAGAGQSPRLCSLLCIVLPSSCRDTRLVNKR